MMNIKDFKILFSKYVTAKEPFLFIIDFECQKPYLVRLEDAFAKGLYYNINGSSNVKQINVNKKIQLTSHPVEKNIYAKRFNKVITSLKNGETYLLNLTSPSEIETNLSLEEIFYMSQAPYKLLFKNEFVIFSPESFVKIKNNEIFTYPMKGTIDAGTVNAETILMENKKEEWEHNTIVDLMRNDLAMIAKNITVKKYRYVEKIKTNKNEILQTSSEITGKLCKNWQTTIGENFVKLLPAGSISGAPKQKTVEIIKEVETSPREYYTGVFGIFNGTDLDSAVAIRFIEKKDEKMFYRSGGGITSQSKMEDEYNELIQKIYVPFI